MSKLDNTNFCSYCKSNPPIKNELDVFQNPACKSCMKVSFVLKGGYWRE